MFGKFCVTALVLCGCALTAAAGTQLETFDDGTLDGLWLWGNPFGGSQPDSFVIEDGRSVFRKMGTTPAATEYICMGLGGVDNRVPPPWTVEYTIPDASQLVSNGGYLINRFWKPGVPVMDWIQIANGGGVIRIGVPDGSPPLIAINAADVASLRVRFDVNVSGLTVSAAVNGGEFGDGQAIAWQSPVDASTVVGINICAMDLFGSTVIGPFDIAIDDLLITGTHVPDMPEPGEHPRWNPALPFLGTKNLVPNASFECGPDGWSTIGQTTAWGGDLCGLYGEVVDAEAYDGSHSLRIDLGPGITPVTYFDGWPSARVVQNAPTTANLGWIDVDRGQRYTLSAYMKADRDNVPARLVFRFGTDMRTYAWPSERSRSVVLTQEWARYSYTVTAEEPQAFIGMGPDLRDAADDAATVWVDAVQLEKGGVAADFEPREPFEIGLDTERFGNVYSSDEPLRVTVYGSNASDSAASVTVSAQLEDYYGVLQPPSKLELTAPAQGRVAGEFPLAPDRKGYYRARFTWRSGDIDHDRTLIIGVIEPYEYDDSPFGINHAPTTTDGCLLLRDGGVVWVRNCAFDWNQLEPAQGELSFEKTDQQINRELAHGTQSMAILPVFAATEWNSTAPADASSPPWIRLTYAPADPGLLYDFVGRAVEHYTGRIRYYEFINEPVWIPSPGGNLSSSYGYTVADYIALIEGAYPAMKAADPDCVVIGGLSTQAEIAIGDVFIQSGGLNHCDIYNIHPYPTPDGAPERFIGDMNRILGVMDAHGGRKPIWATEGGYFAEDDLPWTPWVAPPGHHSANALTTQGERVAADYGVRQAIILLAHNVEKIFYHQGIGGEANNGSWDLDNALLGPLSTPQKFFAALSALANVLGPNPSGATALAKPATVSGRSTDMVYGYAFEGVGGSVLAAWTTDAGTPGWMLTAPEGATIEDGMGNPMPARHARLGSTPVYVRSAGLTSSDLASACALTAGVVPHVSVSASHLTLTQSDPSAAFTVLSIGDAPLDWTVGWDDPTLVVEPAEGSGDQAVMVSATDFSQDRTATLTVVNDADPEDRVTVTVQVEYAPTPGRVGVSVNLLTLTEYSPSATFNVLNLGDLPLNWSATSSDPTVAVSPTQGTDEGTVEVAAADFSADLTAEVVVVNEADEDDWEVVVVRVMRTPRPGELSVSTNQIGLSETAPSAAFNVLNLGEISVDWTIEWDDPTVLVEPDRGTDEETVMVTAMDFSRDRTVNLTVVNDDNTADWETVVVQVQYALAPSSLAVSASLLTLTEHVPTATFNVLNLGDLPLHWTLWCDTASVLVDPVEGTDEAEVAVTATDFSQDATATITVENADDPQDTETVVAHVVRTPIPGDLSVSTHAITLTCDAPSASFNALNLGEADLYWEILCDFEEIAFDPVAGINDTAVVITGLDFSRNRTLSLTVVNVDEPADTETIIIYLRACRRPLFGCPGMSGGARMGGFGGDGTVLALTVLLSAVLGSGRGRAGRCGQTGASGACDTSGSAYNRGAGNS